ncbi:Gamma-glutamylputrescine oxidoreductase [Lachnellula suecica]|uniref:Gamma-glutamylputrescine oxidoreductase n=1 Tax=Lachnellula suecica TaxID=602035 RepID=A0A8T9C3J6_9HELO|nr:Gamma-glutamylputrescine oxidoreductase [Lachnellula suecica]
MTGNNIFPVPNATLPYWRSELHGIDSLRTTEELPKECDVLIIGAGLSGVSTAYHLLSDNPSPPSIVLLEAREICSGATGRNGGHLLSPHSYVDPVVREHGVDAARELALFQRDQIYAMKGIAEKENLDCDAVLTRYFETFLTQAHADKVKRQYKEQLKAGLDFIQDVQYVGPKYAEQGSCRFVLYDIKHANWNQLSGVKGAKGGTTTTALQLWPYKFVTGLLARLVERTSINIQTHTPVTSVSPSEDAGSIVTTSRGSIKARKVVFATNAYTAGICPTIEKKIVPIKITCSHIKVPEKSPNQPPHLSHTYGINFNDSSRDYLIPRPDGGIICGGAKSTYAGDKNLWFNNVDDSTLIEQARPHFETVMQDNFRGWENSGAAVDYLWTGKYFADMREVIGYTADSWPHCGKVHGQENHYVLAGYNGAGMPVIFLAAKGISKMIREDVPFEESGIPRIFKVTEKRLEKDVTR